MMIVRSIGATALVALMSAHRSAEENRGASEFDQETVAAIEAYLYGKTEQPDAGPFPAIETRRSYN